jgi:coenzyme F420-0:L-glutamate ligase/coenzyme F420-1:gamma-L-glutamate ligase
LLAAHAEELGAVWICAPLFAQEAVREAFELPDSWEPQALVLIGYPAQLPEPRLRRPLDEVVRYR